MPNTPAAEDLIAVGRAVTVFGVKGWLKVRSFTDPIDKLLDYQPHWLQKDGVPLQTIEIDDGRVHGEGLVVHLKGVDDRDIARLYCQKDILVPKSNLPDLEAGEYYWDQLEGLKVYSSFGDGSLKLLGTVSRMMETGANDVMVVHPCEGSLDKKERLLPYLPDHYKLEIDLEAGRLEIDWDPDF